MMLQMTLCKVVTVGAVYLPRPLVARVGASKARSDLSTLVLFQGYLALGARGDTTSPDRKR